MTNSILTESTAATIAPVSPRSAPRGVGSAIEQSTGHAAAPTSKSLLGSRVGELVLRINAGPQAGRTIRLSSPKCTIGSAPNCTLRLRGKGIDPVHCVVLHGERHTIVRRWAGDTFINDHRFEDQTLRAGDRLAIGALEFQVVSLPGRQQAPVEPVRNFELEAKLEKLLVEQLTTRLALANRTARRRLRAVIGKLRKFQIRVSELDTRRRANTNDLDQLTAEKTRLEALDRNIQAQTAELERRRAVTAAEDQALVEQAEKLRTLSKQWNQDRATAQQAYDVKRLELDAAAARIAGDAARLQAEQANLAERSEELVRRVEELARRDEELNVRAAVLERCVGRLQDQRREIEGQALEQSVVAEQQSDRDSELAQLAASLRNSTAAFEQRCAERERLCAERETEVARRTKKLLERERNEVARAQSQADALARQWAVIQAVSDEHKRVADAQSSGSEELSARAKAIAAQEAEVAKSAAALELQAADIAARRSALIDSSRDLDARAAGIAAQEATIKARLSESKAQIEPQAAVQDQAQNEADTLRVAELEKREALYLEQLNDLGRQSEEVARRCESLKQNWSELNERERRLADREAACKSAEATLAEAKLAHAEAVKVAAESAAVEAAAALSRASVVAAPSSTTTNEIDAAELSQLRSELAEREELVRSLSERYELLTLQRNSEAEKAAADQAAVESELANLRARDVESQAGQAAMLEATTIYESKLAELTAELESLRAAGDERDQEIVRAKDTCEALTRETDLLREELASREQAAAAAAAAAAAELETATVSEDRAELIGANPLALEAAIAKEVAEEAAAAEKAHDDEVSMAKRIGEELLAESRELAEHEHRTDEEVERILDAGEIDAPKVEAQATEEEEVEEEETEVAQAPATVPAAPSHSASGESAADVLRRLGMSSVLDDDAGQAAPAPAPKKLPEPPRPAAPAPATVGEHADEDSLNDYMAQLMQRLGVRNDSQAAAAAASKPQETKSGAAAHVAAKPLAQKPVDDKPALAPFEPGEFKARSVAAERNSDLSALRALANANARTAITTHQIKTTKSASKWKGFAASAALITSCAGGYFYYHGHPEAIYATAAGIITAIAFAAQSFGLKYRAQRSTRSLDDVLSKSNAKMNAENNAADAAKKA